MTKEEIRKRERELLELTCMIWVKDSTLTYFIKRFDRKGQNDKVPVEDFAQLAGLSRDT
jgi:serine/threonine-protein kinase HipA